MVALSPMQQAVFDVLDVRPNKDVPLRDLYFAAYAEKYGLGSPYDIRLSSRDMQLILGPLIARINDKLKRGKVVPGELKRTYRLNTKLDR